MWDCMWLMSKSRPRKLDKNTIILQENLPGLERRDAEATCSHTVECLEVGGVDRMFYFHMLQDFDLEV